MNSETWKEVRGYEGLYEVSDLGRVRSMGRQCSSKNNSVQQKRARILVQEITVHGYCRVRLFDAGGNSKHYAVHRLVAEAFLGESSQQVNHINEIKTDNRLINLEYCTPQENCNHGNRNRLISEKTFESKGRQVVQFFNGAVVRVFDSLASASKLAGVTPQAIRLCCEGKMLHAGGYEWRFINGE